MESPPSPSAVHYLPIATTVLSAIFAGILWRHRLRKGFGTHLSWWTAGLLTYGLGTGLEGAITLWGNSVLLNKAWYMAGALLGGYPLAQGTVYLLLPRRVAHRLTAATLPLLLGLFVLVVLSPVRLDALEPHRPGGGILAWSWLRAFTPLVNGYAALFLIGGAIWSARRFARDPATGGLAWGNASIAFGALLPGVGGGFAKAGVVEALYVGEFVGLLFIWLGYTLCVRDR